MSWTGAAVLSCALIVCGSAAPGRAEDFSGLVEGVNQLAAWDAIPGPVAANNAWAAIASCPRYSLDGWHSPAVLVAARSFGTGRVVAVGHETYFGPGELARADNDTFSRNVIRWLDRDGRRVVCVRQTVYSWPLEQGIVAEMATHPDPSQRFTVRTVARYATLTAADLQGCGVLVYAHQIDAGVSAEFQAIQDFVGGGGGVLLIGLGWSWIAYNSPDLNLFPMNQLGNRFGVQFANGLMDDPESYLNGCTCHPIIHMFYRMPTVAITSPIEGQIFRGSSITATGTASAPGTPSAVVAYVEVRVNGGSWQTASGTTSWSRSVSLVEGSNTIEARSVDKPGGYSPLAAVHVTCDKTPPTITGHAPVSPVGFLSHVDVTFSEPINPATFTTADVQLTGPYGPVAISDVAPQEGKTYRIEFAEQADGGLYFLSVGPQIEDFARNKMAASYHAQILVRAISGVISFRNRSGGLPNITYPRSIIVDIWQDVSSQYQWPGLPVWTWTVPNPAGRDEFEYHVPTPLLPDGTYTIGYSVYGADQKKLRVSIQGGFAEDVDVVMTYENIQMGAPFGWFRLSGPRLRYCFAPGGWAGPPQQVQAEQAAVVDALRAWTATGLVWFESTGSDPDIWFYKNRTEAQLGAKASAYYPGKWPNLPPWPLGSWMIVFASDANYWTTDRELQYGSVDYGTGALDNQWYSASGRPSLQSAAIHEVGHALGLAYEPEGVYVDLAQQQWSIMTYNGAGFILWPGWADVAALAALNERSVSITAFCPVDLILTDSVGNIVSQTANQIPGATYVEQDLDGDGDLDDQVTVPEPATGTYSISVVPEPGAAPDEKVTLIVEDHGVPQLLLDDVAVADLPAQPLPVAVDRTPPTLEIAATPGSLAPCDGRMVPVHIDVQLQDETDPNPQVALVGVQGGWEPGASDILGADLGQGDSDFELRAACDGVCGQSYTITYAAVDVTGNQSVASTTVSVPDDLSGPIADCNSNGVPDPCDIKRRISTDCDNDGAPDECQADSDGDGLIDGCDHCPETVTGVPVDASGCPEQIPGDFNRDGDVDHLDLGQFEVCTSGPDIPQGDPDCAWARLDGDDDVDQGDFGLFQRCFSGNRPADPNCGQ